MFSKNEKALRNIDIWKQKGQKQGIFDTTINSDRSERRNDLLRLRHPVIFIGYNFWRVKHGKRLGIWEKNHCRAEQKEISEVRS